MSYKILLLKDVPSGVYAEVMFDTNEDSDFQQVELAIRRAKAGLASPSKPSLAPPPGKRGHRVWVLSVADDAGSMLRGMDSFNSASELSSVLGYSYNAVSMALTHAKKRNETSATLKGVEFCYEENIPGGDHV